jgi:hypothetical protein
MSQHTNYKVRWIAVGMLAIATILPIPAAASGEGGVIAEIEQIVIRADAAGYKFTLSIDNTNSLKTIKVEWGGKVFEFGKKAFGQLDFPDFREYHVKAPTPNSMGKQDHVIMILPYNRESVGDGDKSYNQWDVVRLHFNKGDLFMWEKAEAVEGKPGEWKLTSKGDIISNVVDGVDTVDKNGVHDNGSASSKKNPYDQWPIRDR